MVFCCCRKNVILIETPIILFLKKLRILVYILFTNNIFQLYQIKIKSVLEFNRLYFCRISLWKILWSLILRSNIARINSSLNPFEFKKREAKTVSVITMSVEITSVIQTLYVLISNPFVFLPISNARILHSYLWYVAIATSLQFFPQKATQLQFGHPTGALSLKVFRIFVNRSEEK